MQKLPESPTELLERLLAIFPRFRDGWERENDGYPPTFHSILFDFTCFFGAEIHSFSKSQLREFGDLINEATAENGLLENAFGTCLVEYLHQIGAGETFIPYLTKETREKNRL